MKHLQYSIGYVIYSIFGLYGIISNFGIFNIFGIPFIILIIYKFIPNYQSINYEKKPSTLR